MISRASKSEKRDLVFDILGGGYHRWPGRLDRDLVRRIIDIEIGGVVINPANVAPPAVLPVDNNLPTRRKRAA